jgi:hypothetical protein
MVNWWKWAFFAALVAFEGAREVAVIEANEPTRGATVADVFRFGGFVSAQGQWNRIDDGEGLLPTVVKIQCQAERGECLVVDMLLGDSRYVTAPDISQYPATFSADAVSFQDDSPSCVTYNYRIDLKLKKVFAVREKKQKPTEPVLPNGCDKLERRIEMTLGNGSIEPVSLEGHFLPLLSGIAWLFDRSDGKKRP